jgi:hypothetical protein
MFHVADLAQYPAVAVPIVPAFNLPGFDQAPGRLVLSGPLLARIYLGNITYWDDSSIVALVRAYPSCCHMACPRALSLAACFVACAASSSITLMVLVGTEPFHHRVPAARADCGAVAHR